MSDDGLEALTKRELVARCEELGLQKTGKKVELVARIRDAAAAANDDDASSSSSDDSDSDGSDSMSSDAEHEILGMVVRRIRKSGDGGGDDADSDGGDVMFIPRENIDSSDDEEVDSDDAMGDDEDAWVVEEKNSARLVVTSLLICEAVVFMFSILFQDATDDSSEHGIKREFFSVFLTQLSEAWFTKTFWTSVISYFVLLWLIPTVCGLALGEYDSVDSVFGFTVSRYTIWYLVKNVTFLSGFGAFLHLPLFNVTCAVGAIMAFWDRMF